MFLIVRIGIPMSQLALVLKLNFDESRILVNSRGFWDFSRRLQALVITDSRNNIREASFGDKEYSCVVGCRL